MSAPALRNCANTSTSILRFDNALPKANLSAEQRATVQALRDEGEALHNAGDHKASVDKLAEAMRIILNNL